MVNKRRGKQVQRAITFVKDKFDHTKTDLVLAATIVNHKNPERYHLEDSARSTEPKKQRRNSQFPQ